MDARLILHIGANKTGSSAIQAFLRLNSKQLNTLGYLIPDKELGTSDRITGEHVFAFQDMINRSDRPMLESKFQNLLNSDSKVVIASAENLSNRANFQFFKNILTAVNCKVILYIRRQDELLTSSWQQWNSKREKDFNAWLILALQRLGHWRHCIEGWEKVVGAGNVIIRIFQTADLVNGDVVDDFVSVIGLTDRMQSFVRDGRLVNPSYSDLITPIVSGSKFIFAGEHDNEFYDMVGKLTGEYYTSQKKISLLSPQQRDSIIEYYRLENENLCKTYFPNRPRLFANVEHSKYDYLSRDELTQRQMQLLATLIFAMYKRK
jgi:hypothetical protein